MSTCSHSTHAACYACSVAASAPTVEPLTDTVARLSLAVRGLSDRVDYLEERLRSKGREP